MIDKDVTDSAADTDDNSNTDTMEKKTDEPLVDVKSAADADDTKPAEPDWPDDWRDKLAGGDDKARKRLDRFQSPNDIMKSWQALEQKLSSGDLKASLSDGASEEEVSAYRKANGIPEKPEGYLENLPDGLVVGDEDKDLVNSYIERVHGKNASPEIVAETLDWYYRNQEDQIAALAKSDAKSKKKFDAEIHAEWGAEYQQNLNSITNFLATAPNADDGTPLGDLILNSRLSDGTPMGSHPTMLRWLHQISSDANPAGFIAPGSGTSQSDKIRDEKAEIEKLMRTDRKAYNKDERLQARYRVVIAALEKIKERT